jgi:hypothetical protein
MSYTAQYTFAIERDGIALQVWANWTGGRSWADAHAEEADCRRSEGAPGVLFRVVPDYIATATAGLTVDAARRVEVDRGYRSPARNARKIGRDRVEL